jgi:ABC-type uncharacterized transport system permease subunit
MVEVVSSFFGEEVGGSGVIAMTELIGVEWRMISWIVVCYGKRLWPMREELKWLVG